MSGEGREVRKQEKKKISKMGKCVLGVELSQYQSTKKVSTEDTNPQIKEGIRARWRQEVFGVEESWGRDGSGVLRKDEVSTFVESLTRNNW